ncbi:hypothetical protein JX265_012741 [Neoarthrinium moseri]|uniref:Uncharacterized protein n=1 Tax=Neoarthrinium moseri TaxID=1658444 RepID=A0A9P9W9U9_9PEZI|nr:hypothetical protein JX265_012741 [Neoarthrinium moseri]
MAKSKGQRPVMDYESLMSLSNTSRLEAISAMDRLSRRLSSSSSLAKERRSHTGSVSSGSRSSSTKGQGRKRSSRDAQLDRRVAIRGAVADDRNEGPKKKPSATLRKPTPPHGKDESRSKVSRGDSKGSRNERLKRPESPESRTASQSQSRNRISYISMSSNSTKLGEIRYRQSWDLLDQGLNDERYYNAQTVYPLQPYQRQTKEKRGLLGRIFRS